MGGWWRKRGRRSWSKNPALSFFLLSAKGICDTFKGIVHPKRNLYSPSGHPRCRWVCFFIGTDLGKFSITSLAHQWILCSEWVPSEWESKQLIKTSQWSTSNHAAFVSFTGVVCITCGLLWCFISCLDSQFWRHPFTAEDPLPCKWCNSTCLLICSDEETNSSTSWMLWETTHFQKCFTFGWTMPLSFQMWCISE